MITILKSDTVSTLSKVLGSPFALAGNNDFPRVEVLTSGEFIEEAINGWLEKYTQIRIPHKVIMPDHIHICVDVHKFLEVGLSRAVSNLMGRVSRLRHDAIPEHLRPAEMQPFFQKGFNDRIAYDLSSGNGNRSISMTIRGDTLSNGCFRNTIGMYGLSRLVIGSFMPWGMFSC